MRQINLNVTPEFERDLQIFMRSRRLATKSDAIRQAVHEAVERGGVAEDYDFRSWIGQGLKGPENKRRRFKTEDDLWS